MLRVQHIATESKKYTSRITDIRDGQSYTDSSSDQSLCALLFSCFRIQGREKHSQSRLNKLNFNINQLCTIDQNISS